MHSNWKREGFGNSDVIRNRDRYFVGDFNGDGKTDLLWHGGAEGAHVALSTGNSFAQSKWMREAFGNTDVIANRSRFFLGDFDGGGRTELLWHGGNDGIFVARSSGPVPDLLSMISNGLGSTTTVTYQSSTLYNNTQLPFPVQVVSSVSTNDGNGNVATTRYSYEGGYYHIADHEFRGFEIVTAEQQNGRILLITRTLFHQGNDTAVDANNPSASVGYMKGKPRRVQVWVADFSGTPKVQMVSETTTSYVADDTAPYFNPPLQVDSTFEGKSTRVAYQYDSTYGNVVREDHYGGVADPTDDRTITRSFSPNVAAWIVGLPTNESIYQGIGTTTKVAATDLYYDGTTSCQTASTTQTPTRGNLTRTVRWFSGGTSPETRVAYDNYGNPVCTRDANGNIGTVTYDSSATFPLAIRNPLGHTVTSQYYGVNSVPADAGLYGQVKSVTDANGATTTSQYDVFGRPIQVTAPDGSWSSTSYNSFGGGMGTQHVRRDTSAGLSSWSYFDGLGRTIKEKSTGPDGKIIVTEVQYNTQGQVAQSSLPYFEGSSALWRTMTYDPLGRPLSVVNPDGSRVLSCQQTGISSSVDANNHRRRETHDSAGRVVKVEEYLGNFTSCTTDAGAPYATTQYRYDVLGNLLTVTDAQGNVTRMQYDTLGRKRFMHDPDMGDWSYDYDFNGNLVRQIDSKGQVLTFAYDPLNRLKVKSLPGGKQITYTYDDAATFGIGRLLRVNDASGSTTFTYDRMGRVIKTAKTVQPTGIAIAPATYITQTTYDTLGRVSSITYPDNSIVNYAYNGPLLNRVYDQGTVYVAYSGYNALGQPSRQTFGNGVTTDFTYASPSNTACPESNFRPCTTKTLGVAGTYQDFRYRYDRGGNINTIADTINGDQAFQYDDLDRLLSATGSYGTLSYTYDKIGNLLCNSQISPCSATSPNYIYPPSGSNSVRPHAATRVGANTFTYDVNGNMLTGSGRTLAYDTGNRLVTATTTKGNTRFVYDGNGGRVLKIVGVSATAYVGKLYECTDGQCVKYIFAGDQRIAQRPVNSTIVSYYHGDHLGSNSVVTDAAGKKAQSLTYFPFGETRQKQGTVDVHHKYTGQEHDDSTDLYFYGARYYDPVLGKFITPDTIVQAPYDPHTLNRYSYVRSNPIKYTDPSGHSFGFRRTWRKIEKQSTRTKLFRHFGHWYDANVGRKIKRFCENNGCNAEYQRDFGGPDRDKYTGEIRIHEPTYSQLHLPSISPPSTPQKISRSVSGDSDSALIDTDITINNLTTISSRELEGISSKDIANTVFTVQGIFLTLLQWTAQVTSPTKIPWWAFVPQTSLPAIGSLLTSSHPVNTVESALGTGLGFIPGGTPFSLSLSAASMVPASTQIRAAQTTIRVVKDHPTMTYWMAFPFDPVGLGAVYFATQE